MSLTVLIVDDSSSIRFKLRGLLEGMGHKVIAEASTGVEAIDAYIRYRPQLVTMDIVMPELDGISALQEIKKRDPAANVIMVTSAATSLHMKEAKEVGTDVFVVKPVTVENLMDGLKKLERKSKVA